MYGIAAGPVVLSPVLEVSLPNFVHFEGGVLGALRVGTSQGLGTTALAPYIQAGGGAYAFSPMGLAPTPVTRVEPTAVVGAGLLLPFAAHFGLALEVNYHSAPSVLVTSAVVRF
jgi:hypothetical protein